MADEQPKEKGDIADGMGKLVDEVLRFRAWEALLYLFFARYYSGKEDSIGAATWDRDFLASQRRKLAQDEDGALRIEEIYRVLFLMIEAGREQQSGLKREDDTPIM
jgi:hypothetical protein